MKKFIDWYDRTGVTDEEAKFGIKREIADEFGSGGKVISFSAYAHFGMTATRYDILLKNKKKNDTTRKAVKA